MPKREKPELPIVGQEVWVADCMKIEGVVPAVTEGGAYLKLWHSDGQWNLQDPYGGGAMCFLNVEYAGKFITAVKVTGVGSTWIRALPIKVPHPERGMPCAECHGEPDCHRWPHWGHMSEKAKRLCLAENPNILTPWENWKPIYIPGGWGYWEALAEKERGKQTALLVVSGNGYHHGQRAMDLPVLEGVLKPAGLVKVAW